MTHLLKAGQPKVWFNNAGRMLQLETPGTLRARELGEIYMILASDADEDGAEGEERLPALHSLAGIVSHLHEKYVFYIKPIFSQMIQVS